jgi:SAM-dependent methyltransferase
VENKRDHAVIDDGRVTPGAAYEYSNATPSHTMSYLWPIVQHAIEAHPFADRRAFDLGCGNGATADFLSGLGFSVTGVDPSRSGIEIAIKSYTRPQFHVRSASDDLAQEFGTFSLVVSLEVVAFVLDPRLFARRVYELLQPGGIAVVSTPFHGYWKNLLLSLTNRWDEHLDPFWPGAQLRFFSLKTYRRLWHEAGFQDVTILRAGRIPPLAKAMIAILRKP